MWATELSVLQNLKRIFQGVAIAILLLIGAFAVPPAYADIIPPKHYVMTPGGVNIADGSLQYLVTDLAVGPLKLDRFHRTGLPTFHTNDPMFGRHFASNFDIYVSVSAKTSSDNPRHPIVHMGNRASGVYGRLMGSNSVGPSNKDAEKGILNYNGTSYTYTDIVDGGGTIYTFHPSLQAQGVQWPSESRKIERIDFPDGRRQTFSYNASGYLKLVEDSAGYALVFDYNANGDVAAACAFNRSQTYVNASSTCAGAVMKTAYEYPGTGLDVTDVLGQVTHYTISSRGMTCLKPPGYSTCAMSMQYSGNRVFSQTLQDGGVWGTAGMNPEVINDPESGYEGFNETFLTRPDNITVQLNFANTSPLTIWDALGNTTQLRFEGAQVGFSGSSLDGTFLFEATYPEGNKYLAEYSGPYRAISKETMVPKPGSPLASLVKQYGYQPTCTAPSGSLQNCAKPIWIRDPKGNQTDYTYALHGGLLTELKPAPVAGAPRPLRFVTYLQKYAYIRDSVGALVQASTPIWVVNTETQCQAVAGSADPTCDPSGPQAVTAYQYGSDGTANNLLVRGVAVTADGETRRTCFSYDPLGRRVSETRPRANLSVCP